jgi:hypothetical protein
MLDLEQTFLEFETGGIAKVRCAKCGDVLGRVQVSPPSPEDDPVVWEEKVQGEIDVLNAEHQKECGKSNTPSR